MSKADIINVTTLAAHLAYLVPDAGSRPQPWMARQASKDAMTLQRLGRRARHMRWVDLWGFGWVPDSEDAPRIKALLGEVLSPYGLRGDVVESGVIILGLPGNTLGGDEDGYGI